MKKDKIHISPISSILSTQNLLDLVVPLYEIKNPISCEFIFKGANDSYKVSSPTGNYLLRVYSKSWRTKTDVQFELEALVPLHKKGVKVSNPIIRKDGEFITSIEAPEGTRYVIITNFAEAEWTADGHLLKDWTLYGEQVAQIHNQSDDFVSNSDRFKIDLDLLIKDPLEKIKPFFKNSPEDWEFLVDYSKELSNIILKEDQNQLDFGFCHGDFHGGNARLLNSELTFFDFDCCGYGLRAYDLAVFKWSSRLNGKETENWNLFYNAYKQNRAISEKDFLLVEPFISIRHIWLMGFNVTHHMSKIGWCSEVYFDKAIGFLKEAKSKHEKL